MPLFPCCNIWHIVFRALTLETDLRCCPVSTCESPRHTDLHLQANRPTSDILHVVCSRGQGQLDVKNLKFAESEGQLVMAYRERRQSRQGACDRTHRHVGQQVGHYCAHGDVILITEDQPECMLQLRPLLPGDQVRDVPGQQQSEAWWYVTWQAMGSLRGFTQPLWPRGVVLGKLPPQTSHLGTDNLQRETASLDTA